MSEGRLTQFADFRLNSWCGLSEDCGFDPPCDAHRMLLLLDAYSKFDDLIAVCMDSRREDYRSWEALRYGD